jgi:cytochrome P450
LRDLSFDLEPGSVVGIIGRNGSGKSTLMRHLSALVMGDASSPSRIEVNGVTVKGGDRVALGWASANLDERAFDKPEEIRLDRKPNPHISFGFGTHLCLGAPHARLIVRTLLQKCCERVGSIQVMEAKRNVERTESFEREVAYESLTVQFSAR